MCLFVLSVNSLLAQKKRHFSVILDKTTEYCTKAAAALRIEEETHADSLSIQWSSGFTGVKVINGLSAGDYLVRIFVHNRDSSFQALDTTIYFTIEKEKCPVVVPKYFSPNNDNYNDLLEIANIVYYPNFELMIYNKLGQRVHHQHKEFEPWDGKWLGAPLPDGSYYYLLVYDKDNKKEFVQGDITILR
jgi:gliding motility-associated-like protein